MMTVSFSYFGNSQNSTRNVKSSNSLTVSCDNLRGPTGSSCRIRITGGGLEYKEQIAVQNSNDFPPNKVTECGGLTFSIEQKFYVYPGQNPVLVCTSAPKIKDYAKILGLNSLTGGASVSSGKLITINDDSVNCKEVSISGTEYIFAFTFNNNLNHYVPLSIAITAVLIVHDQGGNIASYGKYSTNYQESISWSNVLQTVIQIAEALLKAD